MCGIAGTITRSPNQFNSPTEAMVSALLHRGPDSEGHFSGPHISMGMRRLSIIDVSGGNQPFHSEDGRFSLICNGEIYNYLDLRKELIAKGHRFSSKSDCETIVHLFEEHGENTPLFLRGMFSFAIWDRLERKLFLARDRLGEKPLYIFRNQDIILFSSELKSLLASGEICFSLDPHAIQQYFAFGYVPEPRTMVRSVTKVKGGTWVRIDVPSWGIQERTYWSIENAPPVYGEPTHLIQESLYDVARNVFRSEAPIGVALSGGIDSAIVAAMAKANSSQSLSALSVGYRGFPGCDERSAARETANLLNIPFFPIEISKEDMLSELECMVFSRDDPICDLAGLGYWSIMKKAREIGIKVVILGHGGDELFGGYYWVNQAITAITRGMGLISSGKTPNLLNLFSFEFPDSFRYGHWVHWAKALGGFFTATRARAFFSEATPSNLPIYFFNPGFLQTLMRFRRMTSPEYKMELASNPQTLFESFSTSDNSCPITALVSAVLFRTYLREVGLTQSDRLGMAHSVEARTPLVDHRFVETVVGVQKAYDGKIPLSKTWLREAASGLVPTPILQRPKRGFGAPVREWHGMIIRNFGEQLMDGFLFRSGILNKASISHFVRDVHPIFLSHRLSLLSVILEIWTTRMHSQSSRVPRTTETIPLSEFPLITTRPTFEGLSVPRKK